MCSMWPERYSHFIKGGSTVAFAHKISLCKFITKSVLENGDVECERCRHVLGREGLTKRNFGVALWEV